MSTRSFTIDYEDLDALIQGLEGNPDLSLDGNRILLGARLNRRNNTILVRDQEVAELEAAIKATEPATTHPEDCEFCEDFPEGDPEVEAPPFEVNGPDPIFPVRRLFRIVGNAVPVPYEPKGQYDRFVLWLQVGTLHKQAHCRAVNGGVPMQKVCHSRKVMEATAAIAKCVCCWHLDAEPAGPFDPATPKRGGGRTLPVRPSNATQECDDFPPDAGFTLRERTGQDGMPSSSRWPWSRNKKLTTPSPDILPVILPPPVAHVTPDKE